MSEDERMSEGRVARVGDLGTHRDVQEVRRVDERELSVAHWHLIEPREWSVSDTARFDNDRMRAERVRSSAGVARSVDEVVAWLDRTLDELIARYELSEAQLRSSGIHTPALRETVSEIRREMAEHGRDICAMLAVRGGRIVHYSAYAEPSCTAPH